MLSSEVHQEQQGSIERISSNHRRAPDAQQVGNTSVSRFRIKALNHDNRRNAEQVADLFRRSYGSSYPAREVYRPEHWYSPESDNFSAELGNCMTSMVALDGDRIIAHMALRHDTDGRRVEFVYPAIHPAYRKQVFTLCRLFWNTITDLAERQQLEFVYFYNLLSHPMWQLVAGKCFHSEVTAVIPNIAGSVPNVAHRPHSRSSFLLMYNMFEARHHSPRMFYVPKEHRTFIAMQFDRLGLSRLPGSASSRAAYSPQQTTPLVPATSVIHKSGFGVYHLRVEPRLLSNYAEIQRCLETLSPKQQKRSIISVSMDHPAAEDVCTYIAGDGYRFCGIAPLDGASDRILYARYTVDDIRALSLYSPAAKRIREHVIRIDATAPSRAGKLH